MALKEQKPALLSILSAVKRKVWIVVLIIATSLLLSSCGNVPDYKTDIGDPSIIKELYTKTKQENESLRRKLDNAVNENSKCKENYAALKSRKEGDIVLSEREKAIDERENRVATREGQIKQDQERADNAKSEIFDRSIEIGKKIGQLNKDEERIKELSKELENSNNQLSDLTSRNWILIILLISLGFYIFLDKIGILSPVRNDLSKFKLKFIDTSVIEDNAETLKPSGEQQSKALSSEKQKDK
ncbi:hypothetical protein [Nostoc sp. FACHB-133]|uniref:hypothetical protein n=1 Tax=Nostoc sp. FACHB-133 TaxID=2692835 RepID=UPI00168769B4|nr:hypothetical protein [Nostoc sp. FACHB-133]MBD2527382.1 hypothetical protein [Nostoc sp. FACHB-133]